MGIAGAVNSGMLLAPLFAPRLAQAYGWNGVLGLAAIPGCAVWLLFSLMAKESAKTRPVARLSDYESVLRDPDTRWFCFLYSLTFGVFVGLASFLTGFFHDQYGLSRVRAGDFTTFVVLAGSFLRPVGGMLSDKIGGYMLLLVLLMAIGCCLGCLGLQAARPVALLPAVLRASNLG